MSVAGLILAAGESRRMGRPKALLEYRGSTFLDTLIGLFAGRCSPVLVVLGAGAEELRAATKRAAEFVVNEDYRRGQTSSMQCGLNLVPPAAEGVLFTLVDHPGVTAETVDGLVSGKPRRVKTRRQAKMPTPPGAPLVRVPRYRGKRGHPVWFSRALIPEFLALPDSGSARDVVRAHAAQTQFIDVDDAGVVADIDDPAAYAALIGDAR